MSCASSPKTTQLNQAEFTQLINDATKAIDLAQSVGGEWADSRDLLNKAMIAAKKHQMIEAERLATLAKAQGNLGYTQATSQKNASPWLF